MPKATIKQPVEHDGKRYEVGDELSASDGAISALEQVGAAERTGKGSRASAPVPAPPPAPAPAPTEPEPGQS